MSNTLLKQVTRRLPGYARPPVHQVRVRETARTAGRRTFSQDPAVTQRDAISLTRSLTNPSGDGGDLVRIEGVRSPNHSAPPSSCRSRPVRVSGTRCGTQVMDSKYGWGDERLPFWQLAVPSGCSSCGRRLG